MAIDGKIIPISLLIGAHRSKIYSVHAKDGKPAAFEDQSWIIDGNGNEHQLQSISRVIAEMQTRPEEDRQFHVYAVANEIKKQPDIVKQIELIILDEIRGPVEKLFQNTGKQQEK